CRPRPSTRWTRRGWTGTPIPSCPTLPSHTAIRFACSGRRTGESTRLPNGLSVARCRGRLREDFRTSGSGRWVDRAGVHRGNRRCIETRHDRTYRGTVIARKPSLVALPYPATAHNSVLRAYTPVRASASETGRRLTNFVTGGPEFVGC